jgi:hypothetical protein
VPANLPDSSESATTIPSVWIAGAVRTGIGLVIGIVAGLGFWAIPYFQTHDVIGNWVFFISLFFVRIFEWWLLLKWVYRIFHFTPKQYSIVIVLGILTSFVLDAIGVVAALVIPGGAWVC